MGYWSILQQLGTNCKACLRIMSLSWIGYMVCEYWEGSCDKHNNYTPSRLFRLYPEVTKADIHIKIHWLTKKCVFKNHHIRQYEALVNIATMGHKLQGISKDNVIAANWFYGVKIWVDQTLIGLYLFKPIDQKKT